MNNWLKYNSKQLVNRFVTHICYIQSKREHFVKYLQSWSRVIDALGYCLVLLDEFPALITFSTPFGRCQYLRLLFGMVHAGGCCSRGWGVQRHPSLPLSKIWLGGYEYNEELVPSSRQRTLQNDPSKSHRKVELTELEIGNIDVVS